MTKTFFQKTIDKRLISCYNLDRKKEREVNKMKYAVSAYKVYEEFATEKEARAYFNRVKHNFTYCELKRVTESDYCYRSESVEIFTK